MTNRALVLGLLVAAAALTLLAGGASAQQSVENETLFGDNPIAFSPIDTYVQEAQPSPENRHTATEVRLRGEDTGPSPEDPEDEGQRVYLLSLSPSGGGGIRDEVRERYVHGEVENVTLSLRYEGGCDGTLGTLNVRAIESRNWDPRNIRWNDTDLSDNDDPEVRVQGPVVASGQAGMAAGNCTRMEFNLDSDVAPLLEGTWGGLAVLWDASYPITLFTTSNADEQGVGASPHLRVELTTNAPLVEDVRLGGPVPRLLEPGSPLRVTADVARDDAVPPEGVEIRLFDEEEQVANSFAARVEPGSWRADFTAPDEEGLYTVRAQATDRFAWTSEASARAEGPSLVLDASPPQLNRSRLDGVAPGGDVEIDEGTEAPLDLELLDLACRAGRDPCVHWSMAWGPPGEEPWRRWNGSGSHVEAGPARVEELLPMDRPGSWTARLSVEDPLGHVNETSWSLTVRDTHPPDARPLETSMLGPNVTVNLQEGQRVRLAAEVVDDPPVDASLRFEPVDGDGEEVARTLSPVGNGTTLRENVSAPPVGTYQTVLAIDDGTHPETALAWGTLTVSPGRAPGIHVEPVHRRLGPDTLVRAKLHDGNLSLAETRVEAFVGGSSLTPEVDLEPAEGGGVAEIRLRGLSHGETVRVVVNASDDTGHRSEIEASFDVDLRAPELIAPANGTWLRPEDDLAIRARDPGGGLARVKARGPAGQRSLAPPASVPARVLLPTDRAGLHPVAFEVSDDVGNRKEIQRRVGMDPHPPEIEPEINASGLLLHVTDVGSNVSQVDVRAIVEEGTMDPRSLAQVGPGVYRVLGLESLRRGDEVLVAVEATDGAGNAKRYGTPENPKRLTVPDRAPQTQLEHRTPAAGSEATVGWQVRDPDGDPVNVSLEIVGPGGDATRLTDLDTHGEHTIQPSEPGRYRVHLRADAHGARSSDTRNVYLGPGGEVTSVEPVPERIGPDDALEIRLDPPGTPDRILVWAEDGEEVRRSAEVIREDGSAVARFERLPEGTHELHATVYHEAGAVEEREIGTLEVGTSAAERASRAAPVILGVLVLAGLAALAVAYVRQARDEAD